MMKRTSLTFLAAIGLYVAALVLPRDMPDTVVTVALDLAGVEEVEVVSPSGVGILFESAASPQLQYPVGSGHEVTVTRDGRRLRIVSNVRSYQALDIRLTPGVRRLVVPDAMIGTQVALDALAIDIAGDLRWEGGVGQLSINDVSPGRDRVTAAKPAGGSPHRESVCAPHCGLNLVIASGRIGRLSVTTPGSRVSLADVDAIARTTLMLGPEARFSIEQASRIPDITLLPYPAQDPATEAKKP